MPMSSMMSRRSQESSNKCDDGDRKHHTSFRRQGADGREYYRRVTVDRETKAKFAPMKPYTRVGEQLSVNRISKNGQTVTLSDGSLWRVSVGDVTKTLCWYPTQRVVVENCDDVVYPYELRNLDTVADVAKASLA
jgi:hypothetical protein